MENKIMEKITNGMKVNNLYIKTNKLSETLDKLPIGYINKQVCGCGATYLVLMNEYDAILAVPTVQLIKNKTSNPIHKDVLGVYGNVHTDIIDNYVSVHRSQNKPIKIMVTYDSIDKVIKHLTPETQFVIDEADQLVLSMDMKVKNIKKEEVGKQDTNTRLFELIRKYKDQTSMITASDIDMRVFPRWFKDEIEYTYLHFDNVEVAQRIQFLRKNPMKALRYEIIRPLINFGEISVAGRKFSKIIVFYNSVNEIIKNIKRAGIEKQSGIICGDNIDNKLKIKGIKYITEYDNLPKFTFVTSAGWQGIDLYDSESMNIVISNTSKDFKIMEVDTDIKQAISRQRLQNNPNYNYYINIFNKYNNENYKEEAEKITKVYNDLFNTCTLINKLIRDFKALNEDEQKKGKEALKSLINQLADSEDFLYLTSKNSEGFFEVNEAFFKTIAISKSKNSWEYTKGFKIMKDGKKPIIVEEPKDLSEENSYETIYKLFEKQMAFEPVEFTKSQEQCENYKIIYSCLKEFGKIFTTKRYAMNRLKSVKKTVNTEKSLNEQIFDKFKLNAEYTRSEVKIKLQRIYDNNNIQRKAQFRDIENFGIQYEEKYVDRKRGLRITKRLKKL